MSRSRDWLRSAGRAAAVTSLAAAALAMFAGTASAHTPKAVASCEGEKTVLKVDLTAYNGDVKNTVVITADDKVVAENDNFGREYHSTTKYDGTVAHTFHVKVVAGDGKQYGYEDTLTARKCVTETTSTKPTESTNPTKPPVTTTTTAKPTVSTSTSKPAPTTVAPTNSPAPNPNDLPDTGSNVGIPLAIGGVLVLGGGGALVAARRAKKN
ncbi:LPXTG cell wall anchor domain-containing protein [Actinokineospora sp. NBRC 105648]|uniref:LPXTG cell wall anchor domain-containing protein n=1 Tax=Actinokineospora sp. NBRC 105648 TaxID=3032206 RepID=UPI0024A53CAB|nr:LPXTG cell wall anchor domain-containing protein [Actinokineospora sp. NBRC 105648]GLZ36384.1 hypothetical protein Acsp05_00090 [Actinokineospora sp. NBRC 105648]